MAATGIHRLDPTPVELAVHDLVMAGHEANATGVLGRLGRRARSRVGPRPAVSARVLRHLMIVGSDADGDPGGVCLRGLAVTGALNLSGAVARRVLSLHYCVVDDILLTEGTARTMRFDHCRLSELSLAGATIRGSLEIVNGSTVTGLLSLLRTRIDGDLILRRATLSGRRGVAVSGDRITVGGAVILRRTSVSGTIRLAGADIGGQFDGNGSHLSSPSGPVLILDRATVRGDVTLSRDTTEAAGAPALFRSDGRISLTGARVGGTLECDGLLAAPDPGDLGERITLLANGLRVDGTVALLPGLRSTGEIRIRGAQIGGDLVCQGVVLCHPDRECLDLSRTSVRGTLRFAPEAPVRGGVRLVGTTVGRLEDDPDRWPARRDLDGLRYDALGVIDGGSEPTVRQRVGWVGAEYRSQPYEQLAAFYRSRGQERDWRRVLLAKRRHQRRIAPRRYRPWGWLLDVTVGYGYRPGLALGWLVAWWLVGSVAVAARHQAGGLVPRTATAPSPEFSPVLYTLDLLLPVAALRQRDFWTAVDLTTQLTVAALVTVGWAIAAALVVTLTGLLKKD